MTELSLPEMVLIGWDSDKQDLVEQFVMQRTVYMTHIYMYVTLF